ncbi:MAG: hypothetical protein MHPSP_004565 [Paramarteilia canceri]
MYGNRELATDIFTESSKKGKWLKTFGSEAVQGLFGGKLDFATSAFNPKKLDKPSMRKILFGQLKEWCCNLEANKTSFMGGDEPNLGDLALFGAFYNFKGTNFMKEVLLGSNIGNWYAKMEAMTVTRN